VQRYLWKPAIRKLILIAAAAIIAMDPGLHPYHRSAVQAAEANASPAATKPTGSVKPIAMDTFERYYADVLSEWTSAGYQAAADAYQIPGNGISAQSPERLAETGATNGKSNVLLWRSDRDNWIEYTVRIERDGLYQFMLNYHTLDSGARNASNRKPVMLSVSIDSAFPFRESRTVPFRRLYKDDLPVRTDKAGNDIRPKPLPVDRWLNEPFRDATNTYGSPLQWYLARGVHTIRLSGSEPIAINALQIAPPDKLASYAELSAAMPTGNKLGNAVTTIQAEAMAAKNDVAIQIAVDRDPLSNPVSIRADKFNTVGGARWATGGQSITWKFDVPESGRYKIAMRALQNGVSNMSTFRTIAIDGKVPFLELQAYRFPYSSRWQGTILQNERSEPYAFYLEKGEHTLTMTATIAPFQPAIVQSERIAGQIRAVVTELKAMTGNVTDRDRTWNIANDFPELPLHLAAIKDELLQLASLLLDANGERDNMLQVIQTSVRDVESYLKYPNEIPYYMAEMIAMQEKIGTVRETLVKSGLQLDEIHIAPLAAELPRMEAGLFKRIWGATVRFFDSFFDKQELSDLEGDALNVWVNRGRDYVNLLQELSDEQFTPETGIKVKISLLPDENLLLYANAAGISPDIALGQPQDKSIDFAMRNALEDLSRFPDFGETAAQFAPGALLPFYYNKGYYALPETQSFKVLFYRKDILQQLGLGIPDTWQDVYDMLPTLQQNGYNFYAPPNDFTTFLYQNGAEFFSADGMRTALSSPEAFAGFKQFTDLFHLYDLEKSVPSFYQHFRKGTMPIGIADYNTYVTLTVAAPEITGWWGIAPLPGIARPDGTVARWSSGGQTSAFMYRSSNKKEEAWAFMKWLVSADVQERDGMDLESYYGVGFRWNSANVEAFSRLPWPKDDRNVILEQWRWYKEMPNLPGSYFVPRELGNAWNRTVIEGVNYRESLEEALVNIDREMARKLQEFGYVAADGTIKKTLDWPLVDRPWEGVAPYVAN